jgi:hypothetical protein
VLLGCPALTQFYSIEQTPSTLCLGEPEASLGWMQHQLPNERHYFRRLVFAIHRI